jgi:hypothetical protein
VRDRGGQREPDEDREGGAKGSDDVWTHEGSSPAPPGPGEATYIYDEAGPGDAPGL